jgi:hypothetical protein
MRRKDTMNRKIRTRTTARENDKDRETKIEKGIRLTSKKGTQAHTMLSCALSVLASAVSCERE